MAAHGVIMTLDRDTLDADVIARRMAARDHADNVAAAAAHDAQAARRDGRGKGHDYTQRSKRKPVYRTGEPGAARGTGKPMPRSRDKGGRASSPAAATLALMRGDTRAAIQATRPARFTQLTGCYDAPSRPPAPRNPGKGKRNKAARGKRKPVYHAPRPRWHAALDTPCGMTGHARLVPYHGRRDVWQPRAPKPEIVNYWYRLTIRLARQGGHDAPRVMHEFIIKHDDDRQLRAAATDRLNSLAKGVGIQPPSLVNWQRSKARSRAGLRVRGGGHDNPPASTNLPVSPPAGVN